MRVQPRGDGHQPSSQERAVDLLLLVAGPDPVLVRNDPHLDEMHGLLVPFTMHAPRVVLLRMEDPSAGAHPLREPRVDDPAVAGGVLMHQRALHHPRDDLHVAVGMRLEAHAGNHDVIVVHEEESVMGVGPIVVVPERERVLGVEPAEVGREPVGGPTDVDLRRIHGTS